ncbi:zeta toxin family protein [Cupriavidus gilardii]|uniref:AAA family ATPase n=1 Tax=Cupriavidus gilardii TaxID=82541 RepID=UPI001EE5A05F|nr:AAA family ATPase [Cupriavidus gilardii]MCG5261269.1 AAA family ATPase [Cupriavidus gilardii]MDF9428539.1 zeta toxin family protein [Cupriavidus gilardii]
MPQLWVIGGPNGAGKTTVADRWFADRIPVVSPDSIAARRGVTAVQAGKLAIEEQEKHLAEQESFAVDTTFSGKRELALMRAAKAAGYKVNLVFIGVPEPDLCMARIVQRVADGGHWVPPDDVRRRHARSLANFAEGFAIADRTFVLDNAALRPRLILSWENGRIRQHSCRIPQWALSAFPADLLGRLHVSDSWNTL